MSQKQVYGVKVKRCVMENNGVASTASPNNKIETYAKIGSSKFCHNKRSLVCQNHFLLQTV